MGIVAVFWQDKGSTTVRLFILQWFLINLKENLLIKCSTLNFYQTICRIEIAVVTKDGFCRITESIDIYLILCKFMPEGRVHKGCKWGIL